MRPDWKQYFMIIAKVVALRSTCNSRKGGALIVKNNRILATGYTGSVSGSFQCYDRGSNFCYRRSIKAPDIDKYNNCKSIHAEQNAITYSAKFGVSVNGGTMFCTLQPCYICLKVLAGSGIKEIFFETLYESNYKERDESWKNAFDEFGIGCEQLTVSVKNIKLATDILIKPTSTRKLTATN